MEDGEIYKYYNKRLPHWRKRGCIYLVTISTYRQLLNDSERKITFDAILYWHSVRYTVICVSVMPDHAHLICSFGEDEKSEDLSKIIRSIKAHTARKINRIKGTNGRFWQREFFNRVIRGEQELNEKVNYIFKNAKTAGITENPGDYPFWWLNKSFFEDSSYYRG
jgi:putative transposase